MKKLRKALSLLAALAALGGGLLTSCSGDDETVIVKPSYEAEPSIIIVGHKADKIAMGGTETLEAKILNSDEKSVIWRTDADEEVLTVSDDGLVTANGISDKKVNVWAALSDGTKSNVVSYQVVAVVPKITEVKLLSEPSKLKYATGTPLDLTGLKIGVSYDVSVTDDMREEYPAEVEYSEHEDWFEASGFNSDNAAEKQEVTVTYVPTDSNGDVVEFAENAEKSVKFSVDIIQATVKEISVKAESKLVYTLGEPLALTLHVKYEGNALPEEDITSGYTSESYDSIDEPCEEREITVTYGDASTTCNVTVYGFAVEGVVVSAEDGVVAIDKGATLSLKAVVTPENASYKDLTWKVARVTDGQASAVAESADPVITEGKDGTATLKAGTAYGNFKVTATVTDISDPTAAGKTVSSNEIQVKVNPSVDKIDVNTEKAKLRYGVGEEFDKSGIKVTGTYEDGSTGDVTADCEFSGFDSKNKGDKTITVTHTKSGKNTEFKVTVAQQEIPYTLDFDDVFARLADSTGTTDVSGGTYDLGMIVLKGKGSGLRVRKTANTDGGFDYAINYNSQNYADGIGAENANIGEPDAPYMAVDLSKLDVGNVNSAVVSVEVKANGSEKGKENAVLALTDGTKVLAILNGIDVKNGGKTYDISVPVSDFAKKIYIGFYRNGGTGGGIDIISVSVAEGQAAPSDVTATSPTAKDNTDGKITVSNKPGDAKLQYRAAGDTEWKDVDGSEITGLAPGDYHVRYAASGTKGASPYVTVTVEKYVDETLPEADAPEGKFTPVSATTSANNDGQITWEKFNISSTIATTATIEWQKKGGSSWTVAQTSPIKDLVTPGEYTLRVAAVDDVCKASDTVNVKVKGFRDAPKITVVEKPNDEKGTGKVRIPAGATYKVGDSGAETLVTTETDIDVEAGLTVTAWFAGDDDYEKSKETVVTVSNGASVEQWYGIYSFISNTDVTKGKTERTVTSSPDSNQNTQSFTISASSSDASSDTNGLKFQSAGTSLSFTTKAEAKLVYVICFTDKSRTFTMTRPNSKKIVAGTGTSKKDTVLSAEDDSKVTATNDSGVITVTVPSAEQGTWKLSLDGGYTGYIQSVSISEPE